MHSRRRAVLSVRRCSGRRFVSEPAEPLSRPMHIVVRRPVCRIIAADHENRVPRGPEPCLDPIVDDRRGAVVAVDRDPPLRTLLAIPFCFTPAIRWLIHLLGLHAPQLFLAFQELRLRRRGRQPHYRDGGRVHPRRRPPMRRCHRASVAPARPRGPAGPPASLRDQCRRPQSARSTTISALTTFQLNRTSCERRGETAFACNFLVNTTLLRSSSVFRPHGHGIYLAKTWHHSRTSNRARIVGRHRLNKHRAATWHIDHARLRVSGLSV